MTLDNIQLFEERNDVSINCYDINPVSHEPGVLHISSEENKKHHVNILLYKGHYYTIRSLSRFLCGFRCSNRKKGCYCKTCLTKKYSEQALKEHENSCSINMVKPKGQVPIPGSGEDLLQFRNYEKKFMAPFVIYMDFETYQSRVTDKRVSRKTRFNTQYKQLSVGMKRVCHVNNKFNGPVRCYTGENCAKKAIEMLMEEQSRINVILNECRYPMTNTGKTWQMLKKATHCYICDSAFNGDKKCRDHNHLQSPKVTEEHPFGNVLGIACNRCNLKYSSISNEPKIPVFLHNGSKYDFKLLIRELCQNSENQLKIIPRTSETFACISFQNFQFIDTYAHLPNSLSNLTDILRSGQESKDKLFKHTRQLYPEESTFLKLLKKGFFPYKYLTGIDVLNECKLPKREHFYSSLTKKTITPEQYQHAQSMFTLLKCSNLGEYLEAYLKLDVTLLADVFENFSAINHKLYGLDVAKYLSLPSFSFDAMLLQTKVKLELITDLEQYEFIQKAIRGGMSGQYTRYAKANYTTLPDYNETEPLTYLHMFDCNSLYAYCLSKKLPVGKFRWLEKNEISNFDIENTGSNTNLGYILEVDLVYPENLHVKHSDFPLAPIKKKIKYDELSPYNQNIQRSSHMKNLFSNAEKLVQTLEDKKNYVIHFELLKLYLKLGLKLTKIHRVLRFEQRAFMKSFIEFNIDRRKAANTEFESNNLKMANNALYGKTIENVFKRRKVRLVNSSEKLLKFSNKPTFQRVELLDPKIAAVELKNHTVKLDKPIFIGFTVLELAKKVMYQVLYLFLPKIFGMWYTVHPLYSDTDSFLLKIVAKDESVPTPNDIYRVNSKYFNFSNFPATHPLYHTKNSKKGYFKFEYSSKELRQFVGLKSKQYSILCSCDTIHRAKGVPKAAANELVHADYLHTLRKNQPKTVHFSAIRSFKHKLYTVDTEKIALSAFDDKRYILDDGINSLAYGDYRIARWDSKQKLSK